MNEQELKEHLKQEIQEEMKQKNKKRLKLFAIIGIVVLIAVIGIIILLSGETEVHTKVQETKTVAESMADIALIDLKSRLKDPSSLQVHGKYAYYDDSGSLKYIVIDAGAKNGFGGVTRSYFAYTSYGSYLGTDSDSEVKELLNSKKYTVLSTSQEYTKNK